MKTKPQHRKPTSEEALPSPLGDTRLIIQINRRLSRLALAICPCLIRKSPPPGKCQTLIHSTNCPIVAVPLLIIGHTLSGFVVNLCPNHAPPPLQGLVEHETFGTR